MKGKLFHHVQAQSSKPFWTNFRYKQTKLLDNCVMFNIQDSVWRQIQPSAVHQTVMAALIDTRYFGTT